jgi:beta-1,4-mannooligosaccharide/beta-1,4-mannosyl-N-acetylglucosamine phosphorylase
MFRQETLLKRHPQNPIITPKDFPWGPADVVFNPGQTIYNGKTILLVSVMLRNQSYARTHVAESTDGINFTIHEKPVFFRDPDKMFGEYDNHPIDCRVTQIGDEYYVVRPGNSEMGCIGLMYKTRDFNSFEPVDIVALPDNRVPCLFPEKIGGYYYRLERPYSMGAANERGHIWSSRSPDLVHWGHHRFMMKGFTNWNWEKIGPTVPVKTEKGWLEIIHGVSSSCSIVSYSLGAILLDLENPEKIIGRMESYLLTAEEDYEFRGRTPGCVFATGAIADMKTRRLRVYYGIADTCIGLAEGNLDEIIDACLNGL